MANESGAADLLRQEYQLEPTRSILYRSAASLALRCENYQEAERLTRNGLAGNPPEEIASELRDLLQEALLRIQAGQPGKNDYGQRIQDNKSRASDGGDLDGGLKSGQFQPGQNISLQTDRNIYLAWLNGGTDQQEAQEKITAACKSWLRRRSHGLQKSDLSEITREAMLDTWIETKTNGLSVDESLRALQRSLNRLKSAEQRRLRYQESLSVLPHEFMGTKAPDSEAELRTRHEITSAFHSATMVSS